MIIQTSSRRLAFTARVCRFLPPLLSGRIGSRLYPMELARQENAGFTTRSSLGDVVFSFPRAEHVATSYAVRGFYDWQIVLIANVICRPGDTLVEIGSNIGTETLLYAKLLGPQGRVVGFEPMPSNFAVLEELIRRNGLENVVLHRAAVSDRAGTVAFEPPQEETNSGDGTLMSEGVNGQRSISVESLVLDEMYASGQIGAARLMVMDVQGAEMRVLRGATRYVEQCSPHIVLEVDAEWLVKHESTPADVMAFMDAHAYRAWSISRWGLREPMVDSRDLANWFCVPRGHSADGLRTARRVNRRLKMAALLPLIKYLNPAVVTA